MDAGAKMHRDFLAKEQENGFARPCASASSKSRSYKYFRLVG